MVKDSYVRSFVLQKIICRHRTPQEIMVDNEAYFISKTFTQFCFDHGIELKISSPRYPQGKWTCRSNKHDHSELDQKEACCEERAMGRATTRCALGVPIKPVTTNRRNLFFSGTWCRVRNLNRAQR